MSDYSLGAAAELRPAFFIAFDGVRGSLARAMGRPVVVHSPGRVIFGDASVIYLAQVAEGATALPPIKAATYIHGWAADNGKLYVLDGIELSRWDLLKGEREASLKLLSGDAATKALAALGELQKALQRVEWATLLEQAEDEWLRLTAQQGAAPPSSDERDRLDGLAADFFRTLKSLRAVVGSRGSAAARALVVSLRGELARKRAEVAPWCFSPPVVRRDDFGEPLRDIFVIQGDGTLHSSDKKLSSSLKNHWQEPAELHLAFLDEPNSQQEWLGYVAKSTLCAVDARKLEVKSHWGPAAPPAAGTTRTLAAANGQFWWGADSGVYACKPDAAGILHPTWQAGTPWVARQVGRYGGPPQTPYEKSPDPNELFEKMNINGWIAQRTDKTAPLNDGMTAQLMLSDANGKYAAPPTGTSYLLYGPFGRDAGGPTGAWGEVEPHARGSLVLLSDSRGESVLCRYPAAQAGSQLLPQWAAGPLLSRVVPGSAADRALSAPWPTPTVRPLSKPYPDMLKRLIDSPGCEFFKSFDSMVFMVTTRHRADYGERDLRYVLWSGFFDREPLVGLISLAKVADLKNALRVFFDDNTQQALRGRFGTPGGVWDILDGRREHGRDVPTVMAYARSKTPPVNFDPPWEWLTPPAGLFHGTPPAWYDPWGYNRPGDFVSTQPSPTYLDPFCFDGQLRFPQRPVSLDAFKGRSWAVFADNDPASLQASARPEGASAAGGPTGGVEPSNASTEPDALVVAADEERQLTTFQLLPPKPLRVSFDAASHALRHDAPEFGFIKKQVLAQPTVFKNRASAFPTAWCVAAPEFPSARLRTLATVNPDKDESLWDAFFSANEAKYGPRDAGTAWQIDKCPLPDDARPKVELAGYNLPAQT